MSAILAEPSESLGNAFSSSSVRAQSRREGPRPQTRRRKKEPKKFHLSRRTLIIGGIVLGIILITLFFYWLHARNFVSIDEAELREFARANLAHFKGPHSITFVKELPKTATGKIQKYFLRGRVTAIAPQ